MTTTKSLMFAALLSTVAVASFAQTPAKPEANKAVATTSTVAAAPADAASMPMHKKHHHHHHKHSAATQPADSASMPMGTMRHGKTAMPSKMHDAATPAASAASK